jgi:Iron-containing redox enzyme
VTAARLVRPALWLACPAVHAAAREMWAAPSLRERYPVYLAAMHALIRTSVPLLEAAAAACRGRAAGDPAADLLAGYFTAHAAEERGHDQWLLEDLAALGVRRPDTLPGAACAQDIAALAGAQYYWIHHGHPACLLGYIAVLEGCPPDAAMVAGLPARTGLPAAGFRTLAWHASQDPAHSRELARLLERLPLSGEVVASVARNAAWTAMRAAAVLRRLAEEPLAGEPVTGPLAGEPLARPA